MGHEDDIERVARERLGFSELRPGQVEAVAAVLQGRDTLVVMPTGAGKSAVYQIAAVLVPGPTVVVSPLIALQHDQVEGISESGVAQAAAANSALTTTERRETFAALDDGELEFLFLAPEQLAKDAVLRRLSEAEVSLLVIDEAHCISAWGHDFRPDYLRLAAHREAIGSPTVLALTATASPPVRTEIVERLTMTDPAVIVRGFDRPALHLSVRMFEDEGRKATALVDAVLDWEGAGLIYVATRRHAEELAERLVDEGVAAAPYHAGMSAADRDDVQDRFMADALRVVCATVAFGMGIDKPDVRFVVHYDIPGSVDAYYQEIGRAGRDGAPARALLLYRQADLGRQKFFGAAGRLSGDDLEAVVDAVDREDAAVEADVVAEQTDLSPRKAASALAELDKTGAVHLNGAGQATSAEADATAAAAEAERSRARLDESRVAMIRAYAETRDCRREFVLNYFGEGYEPPCDNCDNCEAGLVDTDADAPEREAYPLNTRVHHSTWGDGVVMRHEPGRVVVLFETEGYRTLSLEAVVEGDLLERVDA